MKVYDKSKPVLVLYIIIKTNTHLSISVCDKEHITIKSKHIYTAVVNIYKLEHMF